MKKKLFLLLLLIIPIIFFSGCKRNENNINNLEDNQNNNKKMNPIVQINTNHGSFEVELYINDAPNTVANFMKLVKSGFYNNTKFHRVIKDFMIQGGDPNTKDDSLRNEWGFGGPGYKFDDEINNHLIVRGTLAMANAGRNTNGSQFFVVTTESTPWLDGKHTAFGEVISGMDVVMEIGNVATDEDDFPLENVIVESMEVKQE